MAHIMRDRAGQVAMPDGTVYDWDADQTLEVDDAHAQEILHIADGGFSEVLPAAAPEKPAKAEKQAPADKGAKPEKRTPAKQAAAKKDAPEKSQADDAVTEPDKTDGEAEVTEPGPEADQADQVTE